MSYLAPGAVSSRAAVWRRLEAITWALRVAAVELGGDGIRLDAVNADQVDTPLFRKFRC